MAISFVAAATHHLGSTASLSVNVPTGTVDDDVMVFFCYKNNNATSITVPAAFTEPANAANGDATDVSHNGTWCYRVASSEPASYAFTWTGNEQAAGIICTFRGVDTTTPLDVTPTSSHTAVGINNAQPSNQSITTASANSEVIVLHGATNNDITTPGAPSGYTLHANTNGNFHRNTFFASDNIASAGAESPGAWTHTDDATVITDYIVWTLALKEAAATSSLPFNKNPMGIHLVSS